nr:glucokinase [Burkholderiaceae bacterium]
MTSAHAPWLVADVGGTRARIGWVEGRADAPRDVIELACAQFATLSDALAHYLQRTGLRAQRAGIAIAAPVHGERATLTNRGWTLDAGDLARSFGWHDCRLLNDFEALALALPQLPAEATRPLGGGAVDLRQTMAVVGPGTGLGVAGCVPLGAGRWIALPGEGGHATLAAADDFESEVLRALRT